MINKAGRAITRTWLYKGIFNCDRLSHLKLLLGGGMLAPDTRWFVLGPEGNANPLTHLREPQVLLTFSWGSDDPAVSPTRQAPVYNSLACILRRARSRVVILLSWCTAGDLDAGPLLKPVHKSIDVRLLVK